MYVQQNHISIVFLLILFCLVSGGLITLLYVLQSQSNTWYKSTIPTKLTPFQYFKGGYKILNSTTSVSSHQESDDQLNEVISALNQEKINVVMKEFFSLPLNSSIYTETTIKLSGDTDVYLFTPCVLTESECNLNFYRGEKLNGSCSLLRCYTIVTNFVGFKKESLREMIIPVFEEFMNNSSQITEYYDANETIKRLPPYKNYPTLSMIIKTENRRMFYGMINYGGSQSIRIKGMAFEGHIQSKHILILANVFLLVYFIQSWVLIYSNRNRQSTFSTTSFSIFPF